jgi:predicted MFS family arabinose efflux permease
LLIATRLVKGACAAFTAPTGLAIIATAFREGKDRGRAMSVYTLFGASGFSAGLIISGLLTTAFGWRWTFVAPAPVALTLFIFGLWLVPRDDSDPGRREATGAWSALLGEPSFVRSCLGAVTLNGAFWGFLFVGTLHLQGAAGWTPFRTALAFLPATLLLLVSVPFGGHLVSRFGMGRLIALGAAAPPIGYALLLPLGHSPAYAPDVLPTVLLVGAGYVLCFSALQVQATSGVPAAERAQAGAVYQSSVQLGGALTVILTAAVLTSAGFRASIGVVTTVAALGFVVALGGAYGRRGGR